MISDAILRYWPFLIFNLLCLIAILYDAKQWGISLMAKIILGGLVIIGGFWVILFYLIYKIIYLVRHKDRISNTKLSSLRNSLIWQVMLFIVILIGWTIYLIFFYIPHLF
jgi:hypothetical protein